MLARNPVSRVKFLAEPNEYTRVLSEDEERMYLLAASQPLQDVAVLMIERARIIIEKRLTEAKSDYLFAGGRGGHDIKNPAVKLNAAHNGGAVKRSEVTWFRLYDLRHTFATRAAEAGVDLVTLAAMLGHSRVQMVMRYAHPTEEHQFNAMRKIEAYRAAKG